MKPAAPDTCAVDSSGAAGSGTPGAGSLAAVAFRRVHPGEAVPPPPQELTEWGNNTLLATLLGMCYGASLALRARETATEEVSQQVGADVPVTRPRPAYTPSRDALCGSLRRNATWFASRGPPPAGASRRAVWSCRLCDRRTCAHARPCRHADWWVRGRLPGCADIPQAAARRSQVDRRRGGGCWHGWRGGHTECVHTWPALS